MTKLITETPDHPIPFLIGHLQTKHESPGHRLHRTLSGSAALWAETDCSGVRRKIDPRPSTCLSLSVSHMPNNSFQKKNRTSQLSVSERFFFFSLFSTEHKSNRRDFRSYDRAWQIHPKKPKKSKSDLAVSNISPPSPESKSCK